MGSLTYFNFNIVIVMILVFFAAYSFYCGFFRSFKLFLQFFISLVVTELISRQLINSKDFHIFNHKLLIFLNKIQKYIYLEHKNLISISIVYLLIFIVIFSLIHLLFLLFSPSPEKRILKPPKLLSRLLSILLGLINTYMIVIIIIFGSLDYIPIKNNGLNKIILNNPLKVTSIEKYNELSIMLEPSYQMYSYHLDLISGQLFGFELDRLLAITNKIYELDYFLEDVVFGALEDEESRSYLTNNLPNSNLSVKGYSYALITIVDTKNVYDVILAKEMNNPQFELIKSSYDFIITHQEYIKFVFEFNQEISLDNLDNLLLFINDKDINESFKELKNLITTGKFYYLMAEWFVFSLTDQPLTSYTNLASYQQLLNLSFYDNEKINLLANLYLEDYDQIKANSSYDLYPFLANIYTMFRLVNKSLKKFDKYNYYLPLNVKLSLSILDFNPNKNNLFDDILVWATVNDTFMSCEKRILDFDGSLAVCDNNYNNIAFFSEYIFSSLLDDINQPMVIDGHQLAIILTRFDKFTSDRYINNQVAKQIFESIVFDQDSYSLISKLYRLDLLTIDAIEIIVNSDYQFISPTCKAYLSNKYLIN